MTVESSMKRRLIFSRRFRSAMMWSCAYGACPALAALLAEALLDGGDTWACSTTPGPSSAPAEGAVAGLGAASLLGCAMAEVKFQARGRVVGAAVGRPAVVLHGHRSATVA